jgi:homoserine kinase type II
MAVYTDVAFVDLELLLTSYDIGTARSFKGIAEGVENSNFILQTDRGSFILTLYEKRVSASDLPFFIALLKHLAARGIRCPAPQKARDGADWVTVKGKPAAILSWLDGLSLQHPDIAHCAAAGAALAELHEAGRDFPLVRANSLGLADWSKLATATQSRAASVFPGLPELVLSSLAELQSSWPHNLRRGIIHADLFPDNVLFMDGAVSGLIDFYFACNDFYAYDLAVMLNAWCFESDGTYNVANGGSLITAYRERRTLDAAEIAALPVLAAGAALRFLLTRLNDWLDHDPSALVRPKDPREFAKRLMFHRQVRSAEEYGL